MSSKAHRRRSKPSVPAKQAFEENENENKLSTPQTSNGPPSSATDHRDRNRFNERAFFTFDGITVEIILNNDILSWSDVSGETMREEIQQRIPTNKDNPNSVSLHNVYAISPIYSQWSRSLNNNDDQSNIPPSSESPLRGFKLHTYDRMEENILQELFIIFQSNSSSQIEHWYQLLSKIISEYKPARNILVICNPHAGSKYSRQIYNTKIKPMLERAHYNITYLEINDFCSADDVLKDFQGDFESLYGLVIVGGDGSVINVINALLRYLAKETRTSLNTENDLPPFPFPICIIPIGTTNMICHSIYGNTDQCTSIMHLLFNRRMKIDMSAIFDVNFNFVTANFSAGAGYPANALQYFTRYSSSNSKKIIQKSFRKAASDKNLKPIEMEIRYISADQKKVATNRCYQGCPSCTPTAIEQTDNRVKVFDDTHLQKIRKRKKPLSSNNGNSNRPSSSRKTSNQQNEAEKTWKSLHHNYLQVAVLTNATLWSFAPQGLSKSGHLADGLLDLVLIEQTTRKDFLRYLKRNGNSKNQYEFAFTNLIKVKEIEIELKLPNDHLINGILNPDNQLDSSLSDDSANEEQSNVQKHKPHPPNAPISEDSRRHRRHHHQLNEHTQVSQLSKSTDLEQNHSDNDLDSPQIDQYNSNGSFRRKNMFRSSKSKKEKFPLPRPSSVCDGERLDEKQHRKNRQMTSGSIRPARSFLSLLRGGNTSTGKQESFSTTTNNGSGRRSSVISRLSSLENETKPTSVTNQYRNQKQPCMWNLDFTPYNSPLIRIKCFYRFLPVFGTGLNPDTLMKEVNYSCFGRIG